MKISIVSLMHQISTRKKGHKGSEADVSWKLLSIFSPAHLNCWGLSHVLQERQFLSSLSSLCQLPEALVARTNTDLSVSLC